MAEPGLALLWPALTIIIGSRSMMMMSLGMLFIARMTIFPRTSKLIVWTCVIGGLVLVYLGGLIFLERLTQVGLKPEGVIKLSSFTKLAPVTNEYYRLTASASEVWRNTIFIFTTFSQYYVHGVPEFVYQVEHYSGADQWGAYTFNVFGRAGAALWGVRTIGSVPQSAPEARGLYDFVRTILHRLWAARPDIRLLARRCDLMDETLCAARRHGALSLYIAFTMQIIMCVAINGVVAAYGIFYTAAFAAFWLGSVMLRRRSRRSLAATGPRPRTRSPARPFS